MRSAIKALYWRTQFDPGIAGILTNPFYFARKGLRDGISAFAGQIRGRTLDVGCGQRPYEHLFRSAEYVGLEIDTPAARARKKADSYYDGRRFPFPDSSFDSVVVNQVLEHVFNPEDFCSEMYRVLKPGGVLLLTVPFVWDEHEQPMDYARYSSFGLIHLLGSAGFRILEHRKTIPDGRLLFQLLTGMVYKRHAHRPIWARLFVQAGLIAPINAFGALVGRLMRGNGDLFLDHVVLAEKPLAE